jgi:DNA-binding NtrC family response regulator
MPKPKYEWSAEHEAIRAANHFEIEGSEEMARVFAQMVSVRANSNVLLRGETGVGKTATARLIYALAKARNILAPASQENGNGNGNGNGVTEGQHMHPSWSTFRDQTNRDNAKFVEVNMAAIPEHLVESELFGHERGSFTGSTERRYGRFEEANGGVLYLDEIGEMPVVAQPKLLTALDDPRRYQRLGSNKTNESQFVAVSSTTQNLEEMVAQKQFHKALLARIREREIRVPALNERPPVHREHLVNTLVQRFCERHKIDAFSVDAKALDFLITRKYEDNVRELNFIMKEICQSLVESKRKKITMNDVDHAIAILGIGNREALQREVAEKSPRILTLDEMIRNAIVDSIIRNHFDVPRVLKELGLHRATFYRKLQALEIDMEALKNRRK